MIIDNSVANGNPFAGVWVTPNWNPPGQSAAYLNRNIGVWYDGFHWLVCTQDRTPIPTGVSFNVAVGSDSLIRGAVSGDCMQMGFAGANDIFIVTPNRSPNGSSSFIYNNHPTGVCYDGSQWWVFNEDGALMPAGVSFNVHFCGPRDAAYVHYANTSNTFGDFTILDNPNLNGKPCANVLVTHNWNPPGAIPTYNNHPVGVFYIRALGRWAIFNQDQQPMPTTVAFNVLTAP